MGASGSTEAPGHQWVCHYGRRGGFQSKGTARAGTAQSLLASRLEYKHAAVRWQPMNAELESFNT